MKTICSKELRPSTNNKSGLRSLKNIISSKKIDKKCSKINLTMTQARNLRRDHPKANNKNRRSPGNIKSNLWVQRVKHKHNFSFASHKKRQNK